MNGILLRADGDHAEEERSLYDERTVEFIERVVGDDAMLLRTNAHERITGFEKYDIWIEEPKIFGNNGSATVVLEVWDYKEEKATMVPIYGNVLVTARDSCWNTVEMELFREQDEVISELHRRMPKAKGEQKQ